MNTYLITNKKNLLYLTNKTYSNFFILKHNNQKYLFTDPRYSHAKNENPNFKVVILKDLKKDIQEFLNNKKIKEILFNPNDLTIERLKNFKKLFKKIKFKAQKKEPAFLNREIKNQNEIKLLKKSQEINEKIYLEIKKELKTGIKEIEIAKKIKILALNNNVEISFEPIVGFGENSANIHHTPTERKLKKNDAVLIDMGIIYNNYCSDMTRCIKAKDNEEYQKDYNFLLNLINEIEKNFKKFKTYKSLNNYIKKEYKKINYTLPHSLGHGIGLEVHEQPFFNKTNQIKKGQIITIEPGIYRENKYGIRLENMYEVSEGGLKNLNNIML